MNKDRIKEQLNDNITTASKVEITLQSDGWDILEGLIERKKKEYLNIDNITTIKELEARKLAKKMIDEVINEFKDYINSGIKARQDLDKIEETTS